MRRRRSAHPAALVRPLVAGDRAAMRQMLGRLSKETIHKRFHAPYPSVPESMLDHIMGHRDGGSFVAVAEGRIVGHAMYVLEGDGVAEMAVLVEDARQSRGIGEQLLTELARSAREGGVRTLTGLALGGNRRVLRLVDAVFDGAGYTVRDGHYQIQMPLQTLKQARHERPAA